MKCPFCGTENAENTIFCSKCNSWILGKRYEEAAPPDAAVSPDRTRCPVCGAENEHNAIFCSQCDSWILGEKYQDPLPPAAPVEEPTPELQPTKKQNWRRWLKFGVPAMALALVVGVLLAVFLPKGNRGKGELSFIPYEKHYQPHVQDRKLELLCDDMAVAVPFSASSFQSYSPSMDGNTLALLTSGGSLYHITEEKIQYISSYTKDYRLSNLGEGLLYHTFNAAYLYHTTMEAPVQLPLRSEGTIVSMVLSPDGKTAALVQYDDRTRQYRLYRYGLTENRCDDLGVTSESSVLLGIANDGKYIYEAVLNNLYCYDAEGNCTNLGTHQNHTYFFNADQTQLLFYKLDGTYLWENGGESRKICEEPIQPILPEGCISRSLRAIQTPIYDLHGQYFSGLYNTNLGQMASGGLWLLQADNTCRQITTQYSANPAPRVEQSCRYLYYASSDDTLFCYDKADDSARAIAKQVLCYTISPDGDRVYYSTNQGTYRYDGADSGKRTQISELVCYDLYITKDNLLCLRVVNFSAIFPGSAFYTYRDGGECQLAMENVAYEITTANGYVYLHSGATISVITSDGTVKQLLPNPLFTVPA